MKKFFYFAAAAVMMLTAACQREMLESPLQGDTKVTFTVSSAEAATKADIADGTNVNILYWEIYGADLTKDPLGEGYVDTKADEKSFIVPLSLVADQEYNIIFWAEVKDAGHYKTDDLRKVEIVDYADEKANDETRAAFYRLYNFSTENGGVIEEDVYLYRPFSQLNLGATTLETSLNLVNEGKVKVESTSVTVTNIANVFNTVKGEGEGTASVIFAHAETPVDYTKKLLEVGDDTYHWLGMNYLIVHGNSDNVTVDIEVETTVGTVNHKVSNVPVKENYRTNLIGDLLTTGATFKVIVDERFVNPETGELNPDLPETSVDQLMLAAQLGGTITLTEDVALEKTLEVPEGVNFVLDLNGKSLTASLHKNDGPVVKNYGSMTITGGTISSLADNGGSALQNNGTLVVENATLNGAPNADSSWPSYAVNNAGKMTLTDCDITSVHGAVSSYGVDAVATLNQTNINMSGIPAFTSHALYVYNGGKIVVNGGNIANKATDQNSTGASVINGAVEVTSGNFAGRIENYYGTPVLKGGTYTVKPNANFVAEGYVVKDNANGTYTVLPDIEEVMDMVLHAESGLYYNGDDNNWKSVYYLFNPEDFEKAASHFVHQTNTSEANGVTFELLADVDLTGIEWKPWDVMWITLNGNNHTISNITTPAGWRAGLFGYLGASKVNDLTLKNVVATGAQAGLLAGSVEGVTANNIKIDGVNTVTYNKEYTSESWGGIGALTGVLTSSAISAEIVKGAKVTLNDNGIVTEAPFKDFLTGYIQTNKGVVVVNGTVNVDVMSKIVADSEGVAYNGELFEQGATDFFVLQNLSLTLNNSIEVKRTYNTVALEGVKAEVNCDLIVSETENTIILHDCDFTLAEGKKLITTANGATVGQVMIHNVKVNGVLLTQATAEDYLQRVNWYEVW